MKTKEQPRAGDNVIVEACDKNRPSCVVTPIVDKRKDGRVPIASSHCGCIRLPENVKRIPHTLE